VSGSNVLFPGRDVREPIAIQRVERPAAQAPADPGGELGVLRELPPAPGPGHDPAVAPRHVAGEEVQPDQPDTRRAHDVDEGVHLGIGRERPGKRPPALDRREAGGRGGGRAARQGQLGETASRCSPRNAEPLNLQIFEMRIFSSE